MARTTIIGCPTLDCYALIVIRNLKHIAGGIKEKRLTSKNTLAKLAGHAAVAEQADATDFWKESA